jgi:hypothetical protein
MRDNSYGRAIERNYLQPPGRISDAQSAVRITKDMAGYACG